jgi:hypothetical protein
MPRAAILKGYANKIVPLESLSAFLIGYCGSDRTEKAEKKDKIEKNEKSDKTHVSSHRS